MAVTRTGLMSLALLAPACCVRTTTRVHTPHGKVAAGSLKIGDLVWSVEMTSGRLVEGQVVALRRAVRECVTLDWGAGALDCTPDHPLFDPERETYRPVGDWVTGAARQLLRWTEAGSETVVVVRAGSIVGVHEVVDLTLAADPHNFLAGEIVVHNKGVVVPGPKLGVEGPGFTLTTTDRMREFRVKACEDGGEIDEWRRGYQKLRLTLDARSIPVPETGETLWLSGFVAAEEVTVIDGAASGSLGLRAAIPPASCIAGFVVGFMRLDERADGQIEVDWRMQIDDRYGYQEDDDEALSIIIEPEP